jgi:hypothetical protein
MVTCDGYHIFRCGKRRTLLRRQIRMHPQPPPRVFLSLPKRAGSKPPMRRVGPRHERMRKTARLPCAVDEGLDQPLQHYQRSRQTQNCHSEKHLCLRRHLSQKLNYFAQHRHLRLTK